MNTLALLAQQDGGGGEVAGGILSAMCLVWVLVALAFVFWLWMLIDALMNEPTTNEKILWLLVLVFLPVIGSIIYFVVRYRGRRTSGG